MYGAGSRIFDKVLLNEYEEKFNSRFVDSKYAMKEFLNAPYFKVRNMDWSLQPCFATFMQVGGDWDEYMSISQTQSEDMGA